MRTFDSPDIPDNSASSEGIYQKSFRSYPDALVILDDRCRCVDASDSFCFLLQTSRERLIGSQIGDLSPKYVEADPTKIPLKSHGGTTLFLERLSASHPHSTYRARPSASRKENRYERIFETTGVAIWEEDFSAVGRQLKQLRTQGVADLQAYITTNPEFIGEMLRLVVVRDVNQASLRLCGAESKDQLLASFSRIFLPETLHVFRDEIVAIWEGRKSFQAETVIQALTGEIRHVALTMEFPEDDPDLTGVLVTLVDAGPRRQTEALLRSSDERQRRAVEAGKVGLWEWDIKNNRVTWSDYVYHLHGVAPGTFGGTVEEFAKLVDSRDRDHVADKLSRALAGEGDYDVEFRAAHPDGRLTWLATSGKVTFDESGQPAWMHGAVLDRTEKNIAQEAQREIERQLMLMVEASGALLASPHSEEVLRTIVELAQRFVSADAYSVWRCGNEGVWRIVSSAGLSENFVLTGNARAANTPAMAEGPMIFEDVMAEPRLAQRRDSLSREGIQSMMAIPLIVHGLPNGSVTFYWKSRHKFYEAEVRIAAALGNLAAAALGTAELYDRQIELRSEAEVSSRRAEFLVKAGEALASSLDYEATLAAVAKLAVPTFADWLSVDLVDAKGEVQRVIVAHVDPEKVQFANEFARRFPAKDDSVGRQSLRSGQSVLIENITDQTLKDRIKDPEQLQIITALGLKSVIVAPMMLNGRGLGILTFVAAESGRMYTAADLQTAEELARRAATAIEHAGYYRSVRISEERYRSLVSATSSVVWTIDPTGEFIELQPSWESYTGQTWEQYNGFGWVNAIHPEDRNEVLAGWIRCRQEEKSYTVRGRVWHAPSAEYRYFVARPAPVRNEDNTIREWVGTLTDIHERRVAEREKLKAEEERNRILVREQEARRTAELLNSVGPILSAELEPQLLAQKITDLATELAGAEFGAFFHNVTDENGESFTLYTISGVPYETFARFPLPRNTAVFGPTFRGEGVVRVDDITQDPRYGHNTPYHGMPEGHLPVRSYLAVPVMSRSGQVLGGLFFGHSTPGVFTGQSADLVTGLAAQAGIALDNSRLFEESQRAQEALRRSNLELRRVNEDLNQFAYSASHDLREPLRMVSIYSQLVKKKYGGKLDDQADQYLNFAVEGAQRMETLVSDILAYTQAANASGGVAPMVDLNQVVTKVLSNLGGAIGLSGAVVTHGELPVVPVHEVHLIQLFQNVLSNAIKYRSQAVPQIAIAAEPRAGRWLISVKDNGIGIEPQFREQIFGLFKRLHSAADYAGTGIGLAICQRIVERYQGRIWVESRPDQGSTFFFTLPNSDPAGDGDRQ